MAGEQTTRGNTAPHLQPVPNELPQRGARRQDLGVIEGRLGFAARLIRFLGTTLLVTFIIGLVGALVLHATIIENQRDLDSQRAAISRIALETEAMRSELAELEAPPRIVAEARELGMVEAPEIEYLVAATGQLDDRALTIAANRLLVNE